MLAVALLLQVWMNVVFLPEPWQNPDVMVTSQTPICIHATFDISKELIATLGFEKYKSYYQEVIANVGKIFAWHNIRFIVDEQNFWETKNEMAVAGTMQETKVAYHEYVSKKNDPTRVHILLVNIMSSETNLGVGFIDGVCTNNAYAVCQAGNRTGWNALYNAQVIAHEVGHVIGFPHVDSSNTTCNCAGGQYCIMNPKTFWWQREYPPSFDSCNIKNLIAKTPRCLLDCPFRPIPINPPVCGNNIVEAGEQCDCAFPEACELTGRAACCDPKTCKFKSAGYQCDEGVCCSGCKFKRGDLCRQADGECDLPDFCGGSTANCPKAHVLDYTKCSNGQAYCVNGECLTKDRYCKNLFPNSNVSYSNQCFDYATKKAATGCTGMSTNLANIFCGTGKGVCGQVYCDGPPSDPFYQFSSGDMKCYTLLDSDPNDQKNKVPQGGVCGDNKICHLSQCKSVDEFKVGCATPCKQYETCNGNGLMCVPNDARWFQSNTNDPYRFHKLDI